MDSILAFALGAVLGVICDLLSRTGAVLAIASCVPSGDLVLAPVFDDAACTHCAGAGSAGVGSAVVKLGLSQRVKSRDGTISGEV